MLALGSASQGGEAFLTPAAVVGATQLVVEVETADGVTRAWHLNMTDQPRGVVLRGLLLADAATLIVLYRDASGYTLSVDGGQY